MTSQTPATPELIARAFATGCRRADRWPLPGRGRTARRFALLAAAARRDVVLGRLVEAHADALAICAELGGGGTAPGRRWGVWAAGPADSVTARFDSGCWRLSGTKHWCSGASLVDRALVDASTGDGQRMFAVRTEAPGVVVQPPTWVGAGMQRSDTRSVSFADAPADPVGGPGDYLARAGFWAGAIGVAACWHGGCLKVAEPLYRRAATRRDDLTLAHLGAVHARLAENSSCLWAAAVRLDRYPRRDHSVLASALRDTVERNASRIMDRVGRALGPDPLAHSAGHAAAVADLAVYIRQGHAERDRVEIGRRLIGKGRR